MPISNKVCLFVVLATCPSINSHIAARHLRTLFDLILTNSEVRKLLSDFSLIGRDLLSTGLSKAAGSLKPTEEELEHVDRAAPQDQFITEGGRKIGTEETPVLEANIPGTDRNVKHDPRTDAAMVKNPDGTERPAGEVYGEAQRRAGEYQQRGQAELTNIRTDVQDDVDRRVPSEDDLDPVSPKKSGLKGRLRGFRVRCFVSSEKCIHSLLTFRPLSPTRFLASTRTVLSVARSSFSRTTSPKSVGINSSIAARRSSSSAKSTTTTRNLSGGFSPSSRNTPNTARPSPPLVLTAPTTLLV